MSTRPEILFPLFAELETLGGIGPKSAKSFAALDITQPRDLLFSLPYSGVDRSFRASVAEIRPPATVTVEAEVGATCRRRRATGRIGSR